MAELVIVTGVMGGGKSYYGVEQALRCAREGGFVMTNLPMRWDEIEDLGLLENFRVLPNDLRELVRSKPGPIGPDGKPGKAILESEFLVAGAEGRENLVIIDEASLEFDVDEQSSKSEKERNKPLFQLAALCRHVGLDFYFLAQHEGNVNAKLRRLSAKRIRCIQTKTFPFVGWLIAALPWCGPLRRKYYGGQGSKECIGGSWHQFDQRVFDAYDTHGMKGGIAIKGEATRHRSQEATTVRGKILILGAVAVMASMFIYGCSSGKALHSKVTAHPEPAGGGVQPAAIAGNAGAGPSPSGQAATVKAAPALRSRQWAEWSVEDEYPLGAVVRDGRGVTVHLAGGECMRVGAFFQGEFLNRVSTYGGWYYFWSETGRVFVARPLTGAERQKRQDAVKEALASKAGNKPGQGFGLGLLKGE